MRAREMGNGMARPRICGSLQVGLSGEVPGLDEKRHSDTASMGSDSVSSESYHAMICNVFMMSFDIHFTSVHFDAIMFQLLAFTFF